MIAGSALLFAMATQAAPSGRQQIAGADWPGYGGGEGDTRYSPLAQIRQDNVASVGLVSQYDIDVGGSGLTAAVEHGGVVYFAIGQAVVHAVDPLTGTLLWKYDPEVGAVAGPEMRGAWGSRGMAYANGRVFVGTSDGRLIALDAKTGKLAWSAKTTEKGDGRYISGAPWVFKDKVVIGHGGADFAPVRGYVTAYDQKTGKQVWRFYTVPGNPAKGPDGAASDGAMAMAAKTWKGEWWKYGGGGTAWNAFSYDPKYNRLYIGTGNGTPWNQKIRSPGGGDNLFVCSIVAVDADTGKYIWHYQVNPGETWDYNAAHDMVLTDLMIGGRKRSVLLQAPKNGFFYVIDRETGKLISAETFAPQNWAQGIDKTTGRPIENPEARFPNGQVFTLFPSPYGAHGTPGMSFNPETGLVYLPAMFAGRAYVDPPSINGMTFVDGERFNTGIGIPPPVKMPPTSSALLAWNPTTQREIWRIPAAGMFAQGATATTAGKLVLQGHDDGRFTIRAADSGKLLWSFQAQASTTPQPITYLVKGRQYISIIAGGRVISARGVEQEWNYRTQRMQLLTFALGGKSKLPPPNTTVMPYLDDPALKIDTATAARGATDFADRCASCHGGAARSGGAAPDLPRSSIPMDADAFKAVLHDGVLTSRGMPRFAELSDAELEALRLYIRQRARELIAEQAKGTVKTQKGPDNGQ
ncbi:PQQ-dependent dehydrogenase, methanol/ethanol family [Sphingomonas oligophenolica]|uniref:PQQ-dependent dehydrogenase, methanol/ethanol family n=2 Tax=Sphingomonas oligophenolica TaxID=301154 RepID=A0ABU9Y6A1_9SPHN